MQWDLKSFLKSFLSKPHLFLHAKQGFEKESIRIAPRGTLSLKKHPHFLGSPLTHPFITTDFAEAQLEIITPPLLSFQQAQKFLKELHKNIYDHLGKELLWPFSMPPILPEKNKISIAQYGNSPLGKKKELYRLGLIDRYGMHMQLISGMHFNFSFSEDFWDFLYLQFGNKERKQDFISESYLHLIRNFFRYGWLITYLFGASPDFHKSYLGKESLYGKFATSFRMSHLGYYSRIQKQLAISYTSLNQYLSDMHQALTTPHPQYQKKGKSFGLNQNILQIENEHYTRIRPKQIPLAEETPLKAIKKRGIGYVEIRALDINPYCPIGISFEESAFLHLFLIFCLAKESPPLSKEEQKVIYSNQNLVALEGRNPQLKLHRNKKDISLKNWGYSLLKEIEKIAHMLDKDLSTNIYASILLKQKEKCKNPSQTPSGKLFKEMQNKSFLALGKELAKKHQQYFLKEKNSPKKLMQMSKQSHIEKENLEIKSLFLLSGYEDLELSTQIIIRESLNRKVHVEILDRENHFLCLTKGNKTEYIKHATKTSKDTYISSLIMENKCVTKQLLERSGFSIPLGSHYTSPEEALADYPLFAKLKVVIKPNMTNFGIGVHFVEKGRSKAFEKAVKKAFAFNSSILIEHFFKGTEYRFLVIGRKLIGVIKRDPANVIGDGKKNITALIKRKNLDPKSYKLPKEYIKLTSIEKNCLTKQRLTPQSIPKKGKKVYLRENSNISTGGDPIDVTDLMPSAYKKLAIEATKAIGGNFCGVDMIIKNLSKKADSRNYTILEMNFNPMLSMHDFPYRGKKRNTGKAVLDFLGFS